MKNQTEIQRAHDILHFMGTPEAPAMLDKQAAIATHAVHDALAWILGYPCGESFGENLESIVQGLRELGYAEVDAGAVISEDEARRRGLT